MAIDIQNVMAVQNQKQEGIIGHLCWYSIGEHLITRDELRQRLLSTGLDEGWLPNEIRVADAFRRATKESERKIPSQANVFQNYICREVYSDPRIVQRNIVLETVDQKGKRLDYDGQSAIMVLDKATNTMNIQVNDPVAGELAREAEKTFHIYKDNYSAQALRIMAMNILKSMSPTPVRPHGGVYFVPSAHSEQLDKWIRFLSSLEKGEGFKVPLVNTLDNRQMVSGKLEDHLSSVIEECKKAMNGNLKKGYVKAIVDDAKRAIGDFNQYRNLVANDIDRFENYVDMIREQVTLLIESI